MRAPLRFLSRVLNVITTLRLSAFDEMFCARMHREHPARAARIDHIWHRLTGETDHCRSCIEE